MELKHLNTFLVLSRLKNFTKTAQYLDYAQSSVTDKFKDWRKIYMYGCLKESGNLFR